MGETKPGGRIDRVPQEFRGAHPFRESSMIKEPDILTSPNLPAPESPTKILEQQVSDYFRGRELPTDAWIPTGVRYYAKLEDINPLSFKSRRDDPSSADGYELETRAAVALQVCPPLEGESEDASFRFVGERGLYARVITGYKEIEIKGKIIKEPITKWVHFNEEDASPKQIRYT